MKKWLSLVLVLIAAAAMVYMEDCGGPTDTPPVRNLDFTIIDDAEGNPGGAITVEWDAPDNVTFDGYIVEVDGVASDLLETTTYDVSTPAALIEVFVDYGSDGLSNAEDLDFGCLQSSSVEVWDIDDGDDPSGFGFGSTGAVTTYMISDPANENLVDYWLDDIGGTPQLAGPHLRASLSDAENACDDIEGSTYENLELASPTGQGLYLTRRPIDATGRVFALYLDRNANDYDETDNFGKARIDGLDLTGNKVTFTLAYQPVSGLRWLIVD